MRTSAGRRAALLTSGAAVTAAFFVVLASGVLGARGDIVFDDVCLFVIPGLASAACYRAYRHESRWARCWFLLSLGMACWALGGVSWFTDEVIRGNPVPFPSLADLGYLGMPAFAVWAMVRFAGEGVGWSGARSALDGLITAASLLFVSWVTVLAPTVAASEEGLLTRLVAVAYPAADVMVATMALLAMARAPRQRRVTMLLLTLGLLSLAVADSVFVWLVVQDRYVSGVVVDTGFVGGFVLIAVAALWPSAPGPAGAGPARAAVSASADGMSSWSLLVPYLPLSIALPVLFVLELRAEPLGTVGSCLCLTSVTAVLARQFVSVRMVASLSGELQHQAFHDPLTGLANRALLADRMSHGLAAPEREPVVLLLADLDGFKAVNDTLGHQAGDELLIEAAARLQTIVRHEDTVARLGGDEFAVLLRSVSGIVDARQVADRIIRELRRPVRVAGVDAVVGASIGIALSQVGATAQELLREADVAMYAAKAQGRNRAAVYAPGLASASLTRRRMQADLADALASDQLTLKYQPIIDLTSGRLVGVEALLRWHHPVYGEVPPVEFIPLAEDSGDIIAIGRWVIERACADAGRWHGMRAPGAPELRLSVNLSGRQLADPGLVDIVRGALCASTLPADLLCLEITESVLLNVTDASNPLRALRDLGVHLAVDDFGTGQSALSRLRDLPVDTLKIDRSFVDALTADGSDATNADVVFSAILHMGRGLAIDVVAEGVETEDQLDALRALGCHHGQGFLIARPADPAVIDDLVRTPITLLDEAPGAPHPSH